MGAVLEAATREAAELQAKSLPVEGQQLHRGADHAMRPDDGVPQVIPQARPMSPPASPPIHHRGASNLAPLHHFGAAGGVSVSAGPQLMSPQSSPHLVSASSLNIAPLPSITAPLTPAPMLPRNSQQTQVV